MAITQEEAQEPASLSSRRGFLMTVGALAAGVLSGLTSPVAAAKARRKPRMGPSGSPETLRKAIEKDKADVGQLADKLRKYELPQATEPAFVFQPRSARRSGK